MSKADGGHAFPRPDTDTQYGSSGMTLRDWFAGQALAGYLATYGKDDPHPGSKAELAAHVARLSYAQADAMLAERDAPKSTG